jgi:membrane associated rhomboid family serine protease
MIPLRDNIPSARPPYINYLLIALNSLVFFTELSAGPRLPQLLDTFGFVPGRFLDLFYSYGPLALPVMIIPLFSSLFLHGGWLHLIGNMWFLYIFGDNVEDFLGHRRYLLFYLLSGVGANLIFLLFSPATMMPLVGASGAIAGVMGAYFILFPGARVLTLVPIFLFITVIELPAYFFLGFWFMLQFLFGTFSSLGPGAAAGGVAWWAHVGGFLVGVLLLSLLAPERVKTRLRRGY